MALTNTGNSTYDPKWVYRDGRSPAEEGFDPEGVDWAQLIELYGDDPVLLFIFGQLEEYFAAQVPGFRSPTLRWDRSVLSTATGSGTNTSGLHLYGYHDTTGVTVSDPVTVKWTSDGNMSVTYDEE